MENKYNKRFFEDFLQNVKKAVNEKVYVQEGELDNLKKQVASIEKKLEELRNIPQSVAEAKTNNDIGTSATFIILKMLHDHGGKMSKEDWMRKLNEMGFSTIAGNVLSRWGWAEITDKYGTREIQPAGEEKLRELGMID